ncbi:arginine deiminase type-3 [Metarhizium anisopliae]
MHSLGKAVVTALGLAASSRALEAVILADTNRDGQLDVTSDAQGKQAWTEERGALFMANIADTDGRCSEQITETTPFADLDKCHDASDNILRNPKFLAPLQTLPNSGLTDAAQGRITVSGDLAKDKVRIFHKTGNDWAYVDDSRVFQAAELRAGLELGIDARDVRRPGGWDGRVRVHFNLTDNGESAADNVQLRVAPVLIHHHLQELTQVYIASIKDHGKGTRQFIENVEKYASDAGAPVAKFDTGKDTWAQDNFEAGYTSIPGPDGPVVLRILIRSSQTQDREVSGRNVFKQLRSASVAVVQHLPPVLNDRPWGIDSLGNLETVPPHSHNGKHYPNGRAVMGSKLGKKPHMFAFIEAQEVQPPIEVDTDWLRVGHTDEFMQFLPANNERGWVMVVDDPKLALDLFKKAQQEGHGATQAMSRPHMLHDIEFLKFSTQYSYLPSDTIDGVLRRWKLEERNLLAAARIQANIEIMKRETGITDADIIRIPALYYVHGKGWDDLRRQWGKERGRKRSEREGLMPAFGEEDGEARLDRRQAQKPEDLLVAFHPAVINGVVFNNGQYLAPNPWGPVVDRHDLLAEAANKAYAKHGFNITYIDDWFDHHAHAGEVHCATNVARDASKKWW